jgi:hypothetical protein
MNGWRLLLGLAAVFLIAHLACAAMPQRGATVPWVSYEAEDTITSGTILGPDYIGHTPAREASGRRCVRLHSTGEYLQFTARTDAQGMVVRYCIPDSPDGQGIDATLSLYINGAPRGTLPMTSRYSYLYGNYPFNNQPSSGTPRRFWDEVRVLPEAIHRGDLIRLQKDAGDTASQYLIDLVDLETVPAPLDRPANSVSVTDMGAIANNAADARPAFLAAIAAARSQHKIVWIPPGRFVIKGSIPVSDITIDGAGMWYSTLVGADDYTPGNRVSIEGNGSNVTLADFAICGKLRYRSDSEANDGISGSFGTGSSIRNLWVEHTKTGAWLTNSDGLLVENCRFRNTIADGINLCVGMNNTIVRNCTARGTGDDCFAMWPATYTESVYRHGSNRFLNCTAQLPSLAQGFAIYGGDGNSIENCLAIDIPYGAGALASTMFKTEFGFRGTTTFRGIDMIRAGDADGAIAVMTNLAKLSGVRFEDINVIDSPTDGIKFNCVKGLAVGDVSFNRIRIVNAGVSGRGCGVLVAAGAAGSATLSNVSVINPRSGGFTDHASAFNLIRAAGNVGVEATRATGSEYSDTRLSSKEIFITAGGSHA